VGTTSSGVAAWALWQQRIGAILWGVITGCAALLAIVKPIVAPAKRIELYTRQHQGWHGLFFAADKLALAIREDGAFSKDSRKRFDTIYDRMVALSLEDEKCQNESLITKLQDKVDKLLPSDSLWFPQPETDQTTNGTADIVAITRQ
jgi:hypothetical protein